ncbi:MAG: F0F1 ATP synthase subunit delta [Bordetella sp.]
MAEIATISRPYAEAAFAVAAEANNVSDIRAWTDFLERCAEVAATQEAQDAFMVPGVTNEQSVELLVTVAGQPSDSQASLLRLLAQNERLTLLPEIFRQFKDLASRAAHELTAEVESAFALTDSQSQNISQLLKSKYASEVKLSIKVNPELIGGVRISIGDEVIDASVREKLSKMTTALLN